MNVPSFPQVDEFSAGINALNGVLVASSRSHSHGYTVAGLSIMAFLFFVCLSMGLLESASYRYLESKEQQFCGRTLAHFKSFSLPWFAILGAHKALEQNLGFFAAVSIGLVAITAGGVFIDLFSGVTAQIVRPSEHIVTTAVIASSGYTLVALFYKGEGFFPVTLIAVGTAFVFRVFTVQEHWAQIVPLAAPVQGPGAESESLLKKTA